MCIQKYLHEGWRACYQVLSFNFSMVAVTVESNLFVAMFSFLIVQDQ